MTRIDETIKKHDKGYNCAQAVACTYCDLVGMDEETMFKVAEGLGLGVGCMEGTCGAVTGACLLAGCKNSTGNLDKVLKGVETGKLLRTCPDCIRDAAAIVEEVLFSEEQSSIPFFSAKKAENISQLNR